VQILERQREIFRERSVTADDAKDRSGIAVPAPGGAAPGAMATPDRDFPDDSPADPFRSVYAGSLDNAGELVSRDARESRVAAEQLEIGAADAGGRYADETFVVARGRRSCLD